MSKTNRELQDELKALQAVSDEDIDTSDIPETTEDDWNASMIGKFYKPKKTQLTIRLDSDVVHWFKSGGKGYQSRINETLRNEMLKKKGA